MRKITSMIAKVTLMTVFAVLSSAGFYKANALVTMNLGSNVQGASSYCSGTNNNIIHSFSFLPSGSGTPNITQILNLPIGGTWAGAGVDIANFKLYWTNVNAFATTNLLATLTNPAIGNQTFAFANPVFAIGTTYYFWVTADITAGAVNGRTLIPAAMTTANFTSSSTKAGSALAGNTKTIVAASTAPTSATASSNNICAGTSVTLTLNGGGGGPGAVIKWYSSSCGVGLVGTGNNLSVTPGAPTAYYGRWEDGAPCNSQTACSQVVVNVLPSSAPPSPLTLEVYDYNYNQLNSVSNNITVCQFQSLEFDVSSLYFEPFENKTFKWKVNGVTVLTQTGTNTFPPAISFITPNPVLINGDVVTLTIKWTGPPSGTCYLPDSITSTPINITVTPNQPPTVTLTDDSPLGQDIICRGDQVIFTANPLEAGTPTYLWYLDNVSTGVTTSTYTTAALLTAGLHTIYCIITSGDYCDTRDPISYSGMPATAQSPTTTLQVNPCYYYVPTTGTLGPYTTCGSPFYDSPGDSPGPPVVNVNYGNNVNGQVKFCPAVAAEYVTISFTSMALNDAGDQLKIFSGTPATSIATDIAGAAIATFTGPTNVTGCNGSVTSNVSGGCLTASFVTNGAGVALGWVASLSCSPTPAPGPLTGTDCSNPTIISALPYAVTGHTTQCYQNSYTATSCGSYSGEDHVYQYTATGPECTSITISGAGGTGTPTLAVYSGCPGVGSCVTPVPQVGNSVAQVTFPSAGVYYIVVDESNGYSNYNLNILSFGLAPPNDLPCNAQYIDLSVNVNGNNTCTGSASEPGVPGCWTGGTLNTSWYSFTAPASGNVRIRTTPGSIGSTQIALYGGSCGSLNLITCNQSGPACASGGTFTSSHIDWNGLTPNTIYYVRVDGRNNTTGDFSIIVVDQSAAQPFVDGQDCIVPMSVCSNNFSIGNPGFLWTGWVCDYSGNNSCMAAGERSSAWYVINISANGTFTFALTPNGSTDYDWVLMDITGMSMASACAQINTGNLPWVRCNWSAPQGHACTTANSPYQTGMCTSSGTPSAGAGGPSFSSAYPVTTGMTLLLNISNYTQNATGFNINFNNNANTSPITFQNPPGVLYWTAGANTTDWFNPVNWGNCGPPDCNTNAIVTTGSVFMPAIQAGQTASCKNLDIKSGASVTMNGTAQLNICGNFVNNGSLNAATTATVNTQGNQVQYFDGNMIGSSKFGNLTMSKTLNNMTILDNAQVGGNLKLANAGIGGKIITGPKELYVTNNAAGAVLAGYGSPTSFVQGYLRRNLNGAAGAYFFPVGDAVKGWQLTKVDFTAAHTIPNMLAYFTQWPAIPAPSGVFDGPCNVTYNTAPAFLDNGYWTLTASANPASATYNMILYNTNVTNNSGCCSWTVMKGASTASLALNGTCDGTSTAAQTKRSGMSGFSVFASAYSSNPLPITLLNFDAVPQGTGVLTTWVTASEINNDLFVIERSNDGVNFEQVGTRKGAGNSSTTLHYSMLDMKPLKGVSYYRLRQVDFDGTESKSQLVAVSFLEAGVLNVFPNPAQTEIQYRFNSAADGVVTFELIDMLGKVFVSREVSVKKGLNTSEPFDISLLPQGVYFVQLKPAGSEIIEPMQKRFVKQTREE